jgi:hypothetical protein
MAKPRMTPPSFPMIDRDRMIATSSAISLRCQRGQIAADGVGAIAQRSGREGTNARDWGF